MLVWLEPSLEVAVEVWVNPPLVVEVAESASLDVLDSVAAAIMKPEVTAPVATAAPARMPATVRRALLIAVVFDIVGSFCFVDDKTTIGSESVVFLCGFCGPAHGFPARPSPRPQSRKVDISALRRRRSVHFATLRVDAAVAEMARVAGLIAIVAIVVASQLARQRAYLTPDGQGTWTSVIPAAIILLAVPIYGVQVLRLFLLMPPSSARTWISIPFLVITLYPGVIGVDRSRRMLARWDERILHPDSEGLDEQTLSQRDSVAAWHTIDQLARSRTLLRTTAGLAVIAFIGRELVFRSQVSDYAAKTPGQILWIGAAVLMPAAASAVVVEVRIRRLSRQARGSSPRH